MTNVSEDAEAHTGSSRSNFMMNTDNHKDLYSSLINLLGKPQDALDSIFSTFVDRVGEPILDDSDIVCFVWFRSAGIEITALKDDTE